MAEQGVVLDIDTKLLDRLEQAEKSLGKLIDKTDSLTSSFDALTKGSLSKFATAIDKIVVGVDKMAKANIGDFGLSKTRTEATKTVDAINSMSKAASGIDLSKHLESTYQKIAALKAEMEQFKAWEGGNLINTADYEYIGGVADELDRLITVYETLEQVSHTLSSQRTFENYMDDLNGVSVEAQRAKYELSQMSEMYKQEEKSSAAAAKAEEKENAKAIKALQEKKKAQEKLREEIRHQRLTSFDGAMEYSQTTKSITEQIQAIKYLKEARDKLDKSQVGADEYLKQIKEINAEIKRQEDSIGELTGKYDELKGSWDAMASLVKTVFAVDTIRRFVSQLVDVRKEFELQRKSLEVLLKSKAEADMLWSQTTQLALKSPFSVKQLLTGTKQLAAYRIESEKLHDTTRMLADVSAGLGVDMERLILAFGQVKAAEFLRGTELRQFTEAGVDMLEQLAEYFSEIEGRAVSAGDVFERVSKRMVSFADVETVFKRITIAGGTFYKMQEKQAETLAGKISNLRDKIDLMLNDIGESKDGVLKGAVDLVASFVDKWELLAPILSSASVAFLGLAAAAGIAAVKMGAFSASQMAATISTGGLFGAIGRLVKAFNLLKVAMATNPALIWIPIIGALLTAVFPLFTAQNKLNKEFEKTEAQLTATRVETEAYSNAIINLTKRIAELKESQKKLNKDSEEYKEISEEIAQLDSEKSRILESLYEIAPKYATEMRKIGDDTEKLTIAAAAYNAELRARLALERQLAGAAGDVEDYNAAQQKQMDAMATMEVRRNKNITAIEKRLSSGEIISPQEQEALLEFINSTEDYYVKLSKLQEKLYSFGIPKYANMKQGLIDFSGIKDYKNAQADAEKYAKSILDTIRETATTYASGEEGKTLLSIITSADAADKEKDDAKNKIISFFNSAFAEIPAALANDAKAVTESILGFNLTPSKAQMDGWAIRVEEGVEALNKKIKAKFSNAEELGALFPVPKLGQTKEAYENIAKDMIDLAEKQYKEGQLLEDEDMVEKSKILKDFAEEYKTIINYFDKAKGSSQTDYWANLTQVIKEANSEYKNLNKTFDEATAKQGTFIKYEHALNEVLSNIIIDSKKLDASSFMQMFDITTEEGMLAALDQIAKDAPKAAAKIKAQLAKGEIEWEGEIKVKEDADKELKDRVDKLFSGYELAINLDKLNIPADFAKNFFDIDAVSLKELREKLQEMQPEFTGTDNLDAYEEYLKKLEKLETDAQQERLKTYLQYARNSIGERAKIKLEELKKLQEIEMTFGDEHPEAKQAATEAVQKESYQKDKKAQWEEFQKTDLFINLFDDLDNASTALMNHAIEKLEEFKEQWKDMPHEEMRSIVKKINDLKEQLYQHESPRQTRKALKEERAQETRTDEELQKDNIVQTEKILAAQAEISLLEQALELRLEGNDIGQIELGQQYDRLDLAAADELVLQKQIKSQQSIVNGSQKIIDNNNKNLTTSKQIRKTYADQKEDLEQAQQMANDLYNAFRELTDVLGGSDSIGALFADAGMQMANTVLNTIALQLQLKAAEEGAFAFGTAMNAAMSIIGWIVMGVQLLSAVFGAIFAAKDKRLQKQIEKIGASVEVLEKQLEQIEESLDTVFSTTGLANYTKAAERNIDAQIEAYGQMIKLESQKKDADEERIKEWQEAMNELREKREEIYKEGFTTATAGILDDTLSAAESFVDAWYEAFQETGDGLSGLEEEFSDMLLNLTKRQAALQIVGNYMEYYKTLLKKYIDPENKDYNLTVTDAAKYAEEVRSTLPQLSEALEAYVSAMDSVVGGTSGLSNLSQDIQGITETTAQALEALLNSTRFYVADSNMRIQHIETILASDDVTRNPILSQLQQQTNIVTAIKDMFDSVIGRGSSSHSGAYLKVVM